MVPRPALVISRNALGPSALLWTLMITNAKRADWPGDIVIPNAVELGLLIPSKIRTAKVAPVEAARASLIGALDAETLERARDLVRSYLF